MFFHYKKQKAEIAVLANDLCVYRGPLKDLPIDEEVICSKSREYFHDPNPSRMHRSAVRKRLINTLAKSLDDSRVTQETLFMIREITACREITFVVFRP